MKTITIPTLIKDGKFAHNRGLISSIIKDFEGQNINLTISKIGRKRSNKQNSFYWGVWLPLIQSAIKDSWGEFYTLQEVHTLLKSTCNYKEVTNPQTGEMLRIPQSSASLSTIEWEEAYKTRIKQLVFDFFGLTLPEVQ